MHPVGEAVCLALVGALWGCTNPLLRTGSEEVKQMQETVTKSTSTVDWVLDALKLFLNARVWLPYALNQAGSVLFYFTLAQSDISLAVPICNGLALVFSIVTAYFVVGEKISQPGKTFVGATLVMTGVTLCLFSREREEQVNEEQSK